jgi:hypothetical protein
VNYKEFYGRKWPNEDLNLGLGQHTAGHALGILLLDDFFWPFMPGDVAPNQDLDLHWAIFVHKILYNSHRSFQDELCLNSEISHRIIQ